MYSFGSCIFSASHFLHSHIAACINSSIISIVEGHFIIHATCLFILLLMNIWVVSRLGALMNEIAMHIFIQIILWMHVSFSLVRPRSGITRYYRIGACQLLKKVTFQDGFTICIFKLAISEISSFKSSLTSVCHFSHTNGCEEDLIIVFIFTYLLISDDELLFMCLLAIPTSSFVKCGFKNFTNF